jgi:hypothetical protein
MPVKRFFIFASGVIVAGVLVLFTVLIVSADLRRQAFTYVVPAFNLYQIMSLRRVVRERDFATSAEMLDRHIDLSMGLSGGRSQMVLGLVEAFDLVVERARFESDFEALRKPLERLVTIEPDLYLGRIWLARALWRDDPEKALGHLKVAIPLVSADERAYRQGVEAALKLGKPSLAQAYCAQYQTAQFGGPKPRNYHHLYRGLGLRRLGLIAKMTDGRDVVVTNSGLELNKRRNYNFSLPVPRTLTMAELILGTLPGLEIELHGITVMNSTGDIRFQPSQLQLTTRAAYVASHEKSMLKIVTTNANDEVLRFRFPGPQNNIANVSFDLTIRRLPIASGDICQLPRQ